MIPRPLAAPVLRASAASAGIAGAVLLAGCSGASGAASTGGGPYVDGTYTAEGSYSTPESVETIEVTVSLEGDSITDVVVEGDPQRVESERYQSQFIGGIADEVVGEDIDDVSVTRVAGSSLTSGGFMEALEQIKADAAE